MARIPTPDDMSDASRIYVRRKIKGKLQFVPFGWWDDGSTLDRRRIQFDRKTWPFMEEEEAAKYTVRVEE